MLHLQLDDVDLASQRIHWCPECGTSRAGMSGSRLRAPTVAVIEASPLAGASRLHRSEVVSEAAPRSTASGPKSEVCTKQALWWAISEAEKRARIPHPPSRDAHGFRRMLAGDIVALTSNIKLAGDAIRDKDLRVLQESYLGDSRR